MKPTMAHGAVGARRRPFRLLIPSLHTHIKLVCANHVLRGLQFDFLPFVVPPPLSIGTLCCAESSCCFLPVVASAHAFRPSPLCQRLCVCAHPASFVSTVKCADPRSVLRKKCAAVSLVRSCLMHRFPEEVPCQDARAQCRQRHEVNDPEPDLPYGTHSPSLPRPRAPAGGPARGGRHGSPELLPVAVTADDQSPSGVRDDRPRTAFNQTSASLDSESSEIEVRVARKQCARRCVVNSLCRCHVVAHSRCPLAGPRRRWR